MVFKFDELRFNAVTLLTHRYRLTCMYGLVDVPWEQWSLRGSEIPLPWNDAAPRPAL